MTWTTKYALENLMGRSVAPGTGDKREPKKRLQITGQYLSLNSNEGPQGTLLVRKQRKKA